MNRGKEQDNQMPDVEAVINRTSRLVQLDITVPGLPETIDVLGEHWVRKGEFHVTLIGPGQRLDERLREINPQLSIKESERQVKQVVNGILEGRSFRVIPQDELRIAQENDRKTIVRMCKVKGVEAFFEQLSESCGFPIEVLPTHITLYTLKNGWPIGIYNRQRLDEITRKLTRIEAHEVGRMIGLVDAISGQNYAWGKLARNISEDTINQALEETDGNFLLVDLCSAFPLFAQILRERYKKERCYVQAKKIVGELSNALQTSPKRMPDELKGDFNNTPELSDRNRRLRDTITPKGAPLRRILTFLIEDFLYDPPLIDNDEPEKQIAERFLNLFKTYNTVYEDVFELGEKVGRGRWQIRVPREADTTPYLDFTQILGEDADKFAQGVAVFLARRILPYIRRFTVVSLDILDVERLKTDARKSFPEAFRKTEFYSRINRLKNHISANISLLPFSPESVNFYTCFEGWPFYGFGVDEKQVRDMAIWMLISLKPGGKALFFPWQVRGETSKEREQLMDIEKLWQSMGAKIVRQEFTLDELKEQMVDRELVLVDHSPVFQEPNNVFTALIVEKPKLT